LGKMENSQQTYGYPFIHLTDGVWGATMHSGKMYWTWILCSCCIKEISKNEKTFTIKISKDLKTYERIK
jgi:hypothetical protein